MAKVDDLLQRWTKQIVLTIVARTAHGFSPTANLAVKGITKPPNPEFKNARKPGPTHGFLAKSNTCSRQITPADQSLPNSSRATSSSADGLMSFAGALLILRAQAKRRLNALGTARICNLGTGFMTRRDASSCQYHDRSEPDRQSQYEPVNADSADRGHFHTARQFVDSRCAYAACNSC